MHYVYFLWSKTLQRVYIGETTDVVKRFHEHNVGLQRYTKKGVPWQFVAYVPFSSATEARKEERRLKRCKNRTYLKRYIMQNGKKLPELNGESRQSRDITLGSMVQFHPVLHCS